MKGPLIFLKIQYFFPKMIKYMRRANHSLISEAHKSWNIPNHFLASNYSHLSKKAIGILHAECEKFGKQLLRFQQHRHGQQAGAQRYMESLQLVWGTVGRAQKYQEMVGYFESVLNKGGIEIEWPEIIKSFFWTLCWKHF